MKRLAMKRRGLVLGKFMPPHLGHLYLAEFAQGCVDELAIVVGTLAAEPIDGALRYAWMRELAPRATVLHLQDENPQYPHEHPNFWAIWEASLRRVLPWEPSHVFASESYGARLAQIWGAQFVPVDIERSVVPISGSALRADPLRHWAMLPRCVRPHFVRRISLFGPESSGKSTLARALAEHYRTVMVPEYARGHLLAQDGQVQYADMALIAARQRAAEEALARSANRLLICDTDPLLTCAWSEALFGRTAEEVSALGAAAHYDLTLLTDIDIPFEPDPVRYLPHQRQNFMDRCIKLLQTHKRQYISISGPPKERLKTACHHINALLPA